MMLRVSPAYIISPQRRRSSQSEEYFLRMVSLLGGLRASAVTNNLKEEAHDYITS
jgi:hypothetical protein